MSDDPVSIHFDPLHGIPCWGGVAEYGSWIALEFGDPHLEIRDPVPGSPMEHLRNTRAVRACGTHTFRTDMCDWELQTPDGPIIHSEEPRDELRRAAAILEGGILVRVQVQPAPPSTVLHFDLGCVLSCRGYEDAEPDHELWTLKTPEGYLSFLASGLVHFARGQHEESFRITGTLEFQV